MRHQVLPFSRLLRAARAFLDPGRQLGEIDREQAMRILTRDVVISEALAEQEVERYTSDSRRPRTSGNRRPRAPRTKRVGAGHGADRV